MDRFGDFEMVKRVLASIIGVTGYTGLEQLRLLLTHPHIEIAYLTSRQHPNVSIGEVYPHLSHLPFRITDTDHKIVAKESDIVFLALPHKTAQDVVADIHGVTKVIDHSADFRLDKPNVYEKYYATPHKYPELLKEIVYGLPEINKEAIKKATTVANPGCFALLSQLMLLPYAGSILHADIMAITGSSGSGKSPSEGTHHPIRNHNLKSYNINIHRHIPEIIRTAQMSEEQLNFVPTSGPFGRGIFSTAFVKIIPKSVLTSAVDIYHQQPFVRITKDVSLAHVIGSNFCDLSFQKVSDENYIVQGAIDNLVKGAAGCALQNMNLMFGFEETIGLSTLSPVYP